MDIRGPRLRKQSDAALAFTSSMEYDGRIARHVIQVNIAHMASLVESGEVSPDVGAKLMKFLSGVSGEFKQDGRAEDFHQQLEQDAVDSLGVAVAGYLNFGKSRNDQVATAIRMELRERVTDLAAGICSMQESLLAVASRHGKDLVPGYTHLQRAQPAILAHYMFAYFDAFQRDFDRLVGLYQRVNLSPMGGAALAGTSARVDRRFVARLLGFDGVVENAMDAVSSRDAAAEAVFCAVSSMLDASRLAEELILWSSKEFGFVEMADAYSASSSIMPQKKNPVVAETARAKAGSAIGSLVAVCSILKGLPYSYNLDLQEATPHVWRAFDDSVDSLSVMAGAVSTMKFNREAARKAVADDGSTAVALANYLVRKEGLSFREAHAVVGDLSRYSSEEGVALAAAAAERMPMASAKFGRKVSISRSGAERILDPDRFVNAIATEGGANPKFVGAELSSRRSKLAANRAALRGISSRRREAERRLLRITSGMPREVKAKR